MKHLLCLMVLCTAVVAAGAQTRLVIQTSHTARVNSIAVDNARTIVATASDDHTIRLWKMSAPALGTVLRVFSGHSGFVTGIAFDVNDEQQLASCATDRTIRLWHLEKGQAQRIDLETPASCVAYQPRSNILVAGMVDEARIEFYDANTGAKTDRPVEVSSPVRSIAYSRDGSKILCGLRNGAVEVIDSRTKQRVALYNVATMPILMVGEAATCLVAASESGQYAEIRENASEPVSVFPLSMRTTIRQASMNRSGDTILVATTNRKIVRIPVGSAHQDVIDLDATDVDAVAQNADGSLMVHGEESAQAYTWWLQPQPTASFTKVTSRSRIITSVVFSPRNDLLAIGDNVGTVSIFGLARPFHVSFADVGLLNVRSMAWSIDGKRLFAGGIGRAMAVEIDVDSLSIVRSYPRDGVVTSFLNVRAGQITYVDENLKKVQLLSVDSLGVMTQTTVRAASIGGMSPFGIRSVAMWNDSVRLMSEVNVTVNAGRVHVPWKTASAIGCGDAQTDIVVGSAEGTLAVYDLNNNSLLAMKETAHDGEITSALVAGNMIATGSADGTVKVWTRDSLHLKYTWREHDGEVRFVTLSPNGAMIASASNDGTVVIREVGNKVVRILPMGEDWIAVDQNDRFDGTVNGRSMIKAVRGINIVELEGYEDEYLQPGILTGFGPGALQLVAPRKIMVEDQPPSVRFEPRGETGAVRTTTYQAHAMVKVSTPTTIKVRFYNSNKVVSLQTIDVDTGAHHVSATMTMAAGPNALRVSVEATSGTMVSDTMTVDADITRPRRSRLWLVAIGIDSYRNPAMDLQCAVNDADAVYRRIGSGKNAAYQDQETTLITNGSATLDEIRETIEEVIREAEINDAFVFYYAGRGSVLRQGPFKQFAFVLHDVLNANDPNSLAKESLTSDTLRAWLMRIPCQRQAVIIDACYSGEVALTPSEIDNARLITSLQRSTGATVIACVSPNTKTKEQLSIKHGLFTHTLLEGLEGGARDQEGEVTVLGLANYLTKAVPRNYLKFSQEPNYPVVRFEGAARSFTIWRP